MIGFLLSNRVLHLHGRITHVDATEHVLTVQVEGAGGRNSYTWNESTEFIAAHGRAGPELLAPGVEVVVFYRGSLSVSPPVVRIGVTSVPPRV
jgi:hypothetical protein